MGTLGGIDLLGGTMTTDGSATIRRRLMSVLGAATLAGGLLVAPPVGADHDMTCHPPDDPPAPPPSGGGGGGGVDGFFDVFIDFPEERYGRLQAFVADDGGARTVGSFHRSDPDGRSPRTIVLKPGATTAQCGDTDNDGQIGLTSLTVELEHQRTGDRYHATIVPDGGDLVDGEARGTMRIEDAQGEIDVEIVAMDLRGRP